MSARLPAGFAALEPFVAQWAIPGSAARAAARGSSTPEQREAFFAAAQPLAGAAFERLDAKTLSELDEAEVRLLDLMMSLGHVSLAVEIQGTDEAAHAIWRERMRVTNAPADLPA